MITLILLYRLQSTPAQIWTFEDESVIRIGRAADNHVVLYSAVVSRRHVEVRRVDDVGWEIVSLGANGTYIDEKLILKVPVIDGVILHLARSGPCIQIRLGAIAQTELTNMTSQHTQNDSTTSISPVRMDESTTKGC